MRLNFQPEGPILLRGRTDLLDCLIVAQFCLLICSLIHETSGMALDFHEPHRVLPLAKDIQEREDDVKMEDISGSWIEAGFPPLLQYV
jgi:hypothetical protein